MLTRVLRIVGIFLFIVLGGVVTGAGLAHLLAVRSSEIGLFSIESEFEVTMGALFGFMTGIILGVLVAIPIGLCQNLKSFMLFSTIGAWSFGVVAVLLFGDNFFLIYLPTVWGFFAGTWYFIWKDMSSRLNDVRAHED